MQLEELILPLKAESKNFNLGIAGAIASVTALIGTMGAAVKLTFDWADSLDSIQDVMGVTNDQAAAFGYIARKSGTDIKSFTQANTILAKGLVKVDGTLDTTGKALKTWGINVKNGNGTMKNQAALLDDIGKKYKTLGTQTERVNFLTEIYGKSGAQLVDFFDTLAQEGSIDLVAEKVERLGLVIDPNRYEQFTRNLEELKLVGLGLAVGFTEKVMPALEGFLGIFEDSKSFSELVGNLAFAVDSFVGDVVEGFATSIDNWVASGGPEQLTNKLVSWIENIGTDETQSKILLAAEHLVTSFATAVSEVDWQLVATTLDLKVAEGIRGINWEQTGEAFGQAIEDLFGNVELIKPNDGWLVNAALPGFGYLLNWANSTETAQALKEALGRFFTAAVGGEENINIWKASFQRMTDAFKAWLADINQRAVNGARQFMTNFYNEVITWVNKVIQAYNSIPIAPNVSTVSLGNQIKSGRASGGPVIAGQSYNVSEFFQPERFTPAVNGRIDPMQPAQAPAWDEDRMATIFGRVLGEQLQKAIA